ncbi:MAG TPA: hypothetical protein VHX12_05485 [Acidisoma sp.]|jgi:hypothetical protein|nr:hypothetical protein [Acidisoma sp.]
MEFPVPRLTWPRHLQQSGPEQDPSILLSGTSEIGGGRYLVFALRVDLDSLEADFRSDLDESVYADLRLDVMLEELMFFADFDRTAVVPLQGGHYIFWMVPNAEPMTGTPGL